MKRAIVVSSATIERYLIGVQIGVGLAQSVKEGFRVSAQRLPSGEEVGSADIEANPFGRAARGRVVPIGGGQSRTPAGHRATRLGRVLLRHAAVTD